VRLAVVVLPHAAEQAERRTGLSPSEIRTIVVDALEAGRFASRRPPFLSAGRPAIRGRTFVWDEGRSVAFLIRAREDRTIVMTALVGIAHDFVPSQGATAIARAFERAQIEQAASRKVGRRG
jgi:hypothetical protein